MAAFQHLLQRWGFVRLDRYGLALTPEGRILSTRPDVLDDGTGGRIVGWQDSDLAMAELQPWERAPRAAAAGPAAARDEEPAAQRVGSGRTQTPGVVSVIPPSSEPAPRPRIPPGPEQLRPRIPPGPPATFASDAVMPLAVARDAAVDEDDWEWTIALARARAAAEDIEANLRPADPAPPRSVTQPMATIAMKQPTPAPASAIDDEDESRIKTRPAIPLAQATPAPPAPRLGAPATVIPVPQLPSVHGTGQAARFEPVVRTAAPAAPNRFPKGTASPDPESSFSVGDRTTPGIAMPIAARTVALPSTKGRGIKGRGTKGRSAPR